MKPFALHSFFVLMLFTSCAISGLPRSGRHFETLESKPETSAMSEAAAKAAGHFEIPAADQPEEIIYHLAYSLLYSEPHEQAQWVAYLLTTERCSNTHERKNDFRPDPNVSTGSATHADYKGSGYHRGHLAPSADMGWSAEAQSQSFYYSNMSPQLPAFNTGIWSKLERQVRDWAVEYDSIYVVTGPVLENGLPTIGPNEVAVPKHYYKVVMHYNRESPKAIGFIVPHEGSRAHVSTFAVSVDSVESVTGLNFFPLLPPEKEGLEAECCIHCWKWNAAGVLVSEE